MAGTFIVIDGADGAGKTTQTERLIDAAQRRGLSATFIHFPSYQGTEGGRIVQRYLHGEFGDPATIHPTLASIPYALDRFQQAGHVRELIATHDLVVADRYVISNMAFQGAKLPKRGRQTFTDWCAALDYEVFGNPREDAVLFLSVPSALSEQLVLGRASAHQGRKRDLHETNRRYQRAVLEEYQRLCAHYPHWRLINCSQEEAGAVVPRPIDDIASEIADLVFSHILKHMSVSEEVAA
ncbi:hypothetical protein HY375_01020 [Candidatus Berkelbacteria bacterium]|nr:hypothetical protein [Candidatus Berkelbacteria bacterium]